MRSTARHIGKPWPVLLVAFCLASCDQSKEAGLEGNNPVVAIAYETMGGVDAPVLEIVSLTVRDSGEYSFSAEGVVTKTAFRSGWIDPQTFHDLAVAIRSARSLPAPKYGSYCDPPIHHSPTKLITWTYRDGSKEIRSTEVGCTDDASLVIFEAGNSIVQNSEVAKELQGLPAFFDTPSRDAS